MKTIQVVLFSVLLIGAIVMNVGSIAQCGHFESWMIPMGALVPLSALLVKLAINELKEK